MVSNGKMSVKEMTLYGLGFIVVAFVGVLAGNWFVQWRQKQAPGETLESWLTDNRTALRQGEPFAAVELSDLQGNVVNTADLVRGHKTLVLFLSSGCKSCSEAVARWKEDIKELPADVSVFGISPGDSVEVQNYRDKLDISFPLYSDSGYMFMQQYDVTAFPSVFCLDAEGRVLFALHGYREDFGLTEAAELIK